MEFSFHICFLWDLLLYTVNIDSLEHDPESSTGNDIPTCLIQQLSVHFHNRSHQKLTLSKYQKCFLAPGCGGTAL